MTDNSIHNDYRFAITCECGGATMYRNVRNRWIFSLAATLNPAEVLTFYYARDARRLAEALSKVVGRECSVVQF